MKPKYQRTARGRMPGLVSAGGTLALAVALVLLPGLQVSIRIALTDILQ